MKEIKKNLSKWMYWFILAVAIIIVYKVFDNFSNIGAWFSNLLSVIAPFLMGILIAYLLYIPSSKIEKCYIKSKKKFIKKRARKLAVITTYLIALIIILILINGILPVIAQSIVELVSNFQNYYTVALNKFNEIPEDSVLKTEVITEVVNYFQNIDLKQYINIGKITEYAKGAISAATSIIDIFVAIVVSIYILLERTQILEFVRKIAYATFDKKTCENLGKYFDSTNKIFFKFLAGQFIDAIVVGILTTIAMWIMGIKYAPLLGFMIGLFNIIPYFGAIIAVAIAALITLITGGLSQAIWMLIVVIILQQIDANIINPKIIGNSLKISPLLIIFAVSIGGAYFGVLGMFLAVPVIAVVKILAEDYIEYKNKIKKQDVPD